MKNLILPALAFAFLSISFNSAEDKPKKNFNIPKNIFSEKEAKLHFPNKLDSAEPSDTSEIDNPPTTASQFKDVSSMFNERGYYKSNGFSFDEQELINDFNGNLIYSIPLYNFVVNSGFNLQLKINYNGSVGHTVFVGTVNTINTGENYRFNFNFPEWIVDLNGIAVQVYNFETNFLTPGNSNNYVYGNDVNALIPGYHFSNEMRPVSSSNADRINILAGDGSVICLENTYNNGDPTDFNNYIGTYVYKGKELYYKALVSFSSTPNMPTYTPRKVILLKGDGLEYEFQETFINFSDLPSTNTLNYYLRPKVIYLKNIRDRFSHSINVDYTGYHPHSISTTEPLMGRNLLQRILTTGISSNISFASVWMEYGSGGCKMFHQSDINGNYTFIFEPPVSYRSYDENKNQRAILKKIINVLNQQSEYTYYNYVRRYDYLVVSGFSSMSLSLNNLKRMKSAKSFLGLKRKYSEYFYSDSMSINLTPFYDPENIEHITSSTNVSIYKGQGRDPFFTNMLQKKIDSTDVEKSETTFDYSYSVNQGRDIREKPVDSSDVYKATKVITSKDASTINSSDASSKFIREYRVYPLYDPNNHFAYSPDVDGCTKLIKEEIFKNADQSVYITNQFSYELGTYTSIPEGFSGSFLMKNKKEFYPNSFKFWQWSYVHEDNNVNKPIIKLTETDPFNNYKTTHFVVFDSTFVHWKFISDYEYNSGLDTSYYYQIDMPSRETKFYQNGDSLSVKTFTYINDTASTLGYLGQLISEKEYSSSGFSDFIETKYEYCKHDTLGKHTFSGTGIFPYKEGNLKLVSSNNQETKYYYHPITLNEVVKGAAVGDEPALLPKLKYKILYNTGEVFNTQSNIWDFRFPIRTDQYRVNGSSRDTFSITYKSYALDGSPTKMIDQNKYLTQFVYEPVHRINSITLPGDFSTSSDTMLLFITNNYYYTNLQVRGTHFGYLNELDNNIILGKSDDAFWQNKCPIFRSESTNNGASFTQQFSAYIKFDTNDVKQTSKFVSIDSAHLSIFPYYKNYSVNDSDVVTRFRLINKISAQHFDSDCVSSTYVNYPNELERTPGFSPGSYLETGSIINTNYAINRINIKSLIDSNRNFAGVSILPRLDLLPDLPSHYLYLQFTNYNNQADRQYWELNYAPYFVVYGNFNNADTLKIPVIKGGTIKYVYDDINQTVEVFNVRNTLTNDRSKLKYSINAIGNVEQKNIYTSETEYDSSRFYFNYLNKASRNFDGLNDSTMFSYDGFQRAIKTKNADTSSTENFYDYYDNLSYYFGGTYSGFIEKQTFKDEEGNQFEKYYDAVGNLRRERKFIEGSTVGEDPPGYLTTDYLFDSLYRLTKVKTPEGKLILYSYDAYGRQSKRITVDAGETDFVYDNHNNLTYSQDVIQRSEDIHKYIFRNYDGLNRLTGLGENIFENDSPSDGSQFEDTSRIYYYIVNVYDTISNSFIHNLFVAPNGYSGFNYTKGNLAASAYRTRLTDNWNFKYYRYDQRGRVTKMWNIISGFDTLITEYRYNSQDQLTIYSHARGDEIKSYRNLYDYAGRLSTVEYYIGAPDAPDPEYINLLGYEYNQNSHVSKISYQSGDMENEFNYNNRNWISSTTNSKDIFFYSNTYFKNGNVKTQSIDGTYNNNFSVTSDLNFTYAYDKSNRLLSSIMNHSYKLTNTYDKDGNMLTLKRYDAVTHLDDDFSYSYYSGTNKLKKVTGSNDQYYYDANGNTKTDSLNKNTDMLYDYRNLLIQIRHKSTGSDTNTYVTYYDYDEAGNRIRKKVYKFIGSANPITVETPAESAIGDSPSIWELAKTEIYSRDVSGRDLAIYLDGNIYQWNLFGLDKEGFFNNEDHRFYYLKDHLGSVRVIVDETQEMMSGQDYDQWGFVLEDRTFRTQDSKYKFTGKERDEENKYDYLYARNYNSRIGIFNSSEPIPNSSFGWSSYVYCANNSLKIIDPTGEEWYQMYEENGKSSWQFFENQPWKNIWTGGYDEEGNKVYENVQGYKELLFFQGSELQWLQESGERMIWDAASGILDEFGQTQPKFQKSKDIGPIPEGFYSVSPEETYSIYKDIKNLKLWEIPIWSLGYKSWGFYKTPIVPLGGTETYGRTGFYIHGGFFEGSKGCIDLTMGNSSFHEEFLQHNKTLILNVQYP